MVSNTTQWSTACIDNIATTNPREKLVKEKSTKKKLKGEQRINNAVRQEQN
jgi:hypothetical protein